MPATSKSRGMPANLFAAWAGQQPGTEEEVTSVTGVTVLNKYTDSVTESGIVPTTDGADAQVPSAATALFPTWLVTPVADVTQVGLPQKSRRIIAVATVTRVTRKLRHLQLNWMQAIRLPGARCSSYASPTDRNQLTARALRPRSWRSAIVSCNGTSGTVSGQNQGAAPVAEAASPTTTCSTSATACGCISIRVSPV